MITLDHIGIATQSVPELKKLFQILGLHSGVTEKVDDQGVVVHFFTLPKESPHLELLEVADPSGTVAKFIEKRGPGVHHLSFRVEPGTLNDTCLKLKEAGYRLIYDAPKPGAQNMNINFIHPQSAGGILIELMEPNAPSPERSKK